MFNLGQICQNFEEASLLSSTRALFSDKARCFSQSERALYGNFIIIRNKQVSISLYKIIFLLYFELCKATFFVGQRSSENK